MITLHYHDETHYIDEKSLSAEERALLEKMTGTRDMPAGPEASHLLKQIISGSTPPPSSIQLPARFIYIHFPKPAEEPEALTEALFQLLPGTGHSCWLNRRELLLLQEVNEDFEDQPVTNAVIDTLAADFYIRPSLHAGSFFRDPGEAYSWYKRELRMFRRVIEAYPKHHVFIEQELVLYYMLSSIEPEALEEMTALLDPVREETELLRSVEMFLLCGMNISMAAKRLFMHRNTMQYRVEKFIERTSIDIKQFQNAACVYLLLCGAQLAAEE
ncbi:PucR family transcriptional regulator [Alkalicoccus urumqiensis]|uniref:PucR C-terminal helix-turn-helix domain-containing protein n=1 Tax=Alkalicoccus urumqiensis TaxID=1548213 RepID=A0A2P6MEE1_ALKUR|nr:helix-turn-helix domain-containing protein [Alkalicoccus urumqiensis]PRO64652.1 hypothetical protein C6I21_13170 [Alkalicoccus urumqiensis]